MEKSGDALHIVVLPHEGFSHLRPFLTLSKAIARLGHHVYLLSAKSKIQTLEVQETPNPHLHFVALPGEGSIDAFQEPLAAFLEAASPVVDWILYDFSPFWVPSVAARFGARSANVCVVGATANAFMWPILREGARPSVERLTVPLHAGADVAFHAYEAPYVLSQLFSEDESGYSAAARIRMCMDSADVVAVRSSIELEGECLRSLESLCQKPVLALGHLPPAASSSELSSRSEILIWLDGRSTSSVLYVAFGSELVLSPSQIEELAHGIEKSGVPFIWALRCPAGHLSGLPEGFQESVKGRGLLCHGWVPQVDILAHHAVGGFVSHCGWNSVLESLQLGVPLIMLPLYHDEFLNARMLACNQLGVEIPRKEEDGSFGRDDVAKTVRLIMVGQKGHEVRAKAKAAKEVFGNNEFHETYVKKFVHHLMENKISRE